MSLNWKHWDICFDIFWVGSIGATSVVNLWILIFSKLRAWKRFVSNVFVFLFVFFFLNWKHWDSLSLENCKFWYFLNWGHRYDLNWNNCIYWQSVVYEYMSWILGSIWSQKVEKNIIDENYALYLLTMGYKNACLWFDRFCFFSFLASICLDTSNSYATRNRILTLLKFGIIELQKRVTKSCYAKWRHTSSY